MAISVGGCLLQVPMHPQDCSTSTKVAIEFLKQDFAHFGYPHTLGTDNATPFMSQDFQARCKARGVIHLTGVPYHPATNGVAERLVQTLNTSLRKSRLPSREALQGFLTQYRRTSPVSVYSPSELLNGKQIRTKLDAMVPFPAHVAQGIQGRIAMKSQQMEQKLASRFPHQYKIGAPCYALYHGP